MLRCCMDANYHLPGLEVPPCIAVDESHDKALLPVPILPLYISLDP